MKNIASHAAIILSLFYAVLFVIDRINHSMMFIDNEITKGLLLLLVLVSVINSCVLISQERKQARRKAKKKRG